MNIVICDDEAEMAASVYELCQQECTERDSLCCYTDSKMLCGELSEKNPQVDLFILDIEMPEVDGLELKRRISELYADTNILFLTTHQEMMDQAFGKKVIGFLGKDDYEEHLGDYIREVRTEVEREDILKFSDSRGDWQIAKSHIIMIRAQHIYSVVQVEQFYNWSKKQIETKEESYRVSLNKWEEWLEPVDFYRLNRSLIIHFAHVKRINSYNEIEFDTGEKITIPVKKRKAVVTAYNRYCAKMARCIV
ncbi:MAG: LytR/AlgR family response regulator transcription factor [Lachnospiraceae bacterium]